MMGVAAAWKPYCQASAGWPAPQRQRQGRLLWRLRQPGFSSCLKTPKSSFARPTVHMPPDESRYQGWFKPYSLCIRKKGAALSMRHFCARLARAPARPRPTAPPQCRRVGAFQAVCFGQRKCARTALRRPVLLAHRGPCPLVATLAAQKPVIRNGVSMTLLRPAALASSAFAGAGATGHSGQRRSRTAPSSRRMARGRSSATRPPAPPPNNAPDAERHCGGPPGDGPVRRRPAHRRQQGRDPARAGARSACSCPTALASTSTARTSAAPISCAASATAATPK